jgi:glycosyltransferase involved in cell wall biosynthesis
MTKVLLYSPMHDGYQNLPSGDLTTVENLKKALMKGGFQVEQPFFLKTYFSVFDEALFQVYKKQAEEKLLWVYDYYTNRAVKPDVVVSYHVYHKSPDFMGAAIAKALNIPYIIVEPSLAPSKQFGEFKKSYDKAFENFKQAQQLIGLTQNDLEGLMPFFDQKTRYVAPFIDLEAWKPYESYKNSRGWIQEFFGISKDEPIFLSVAMMRDGPKFQSYTFLAQSLALIKDKPWKFIVVGDGPMSPAVRSLFTDFPENKIFFVGAQNAYNLSHFYQAADLFLWPGIHEAFGVVFLEAGFFGLPVVALEDGGIPDIIAKNKTGLLLQKDIHIYAKGIQMLLNDEELRHSMKICASEKVKNMHGLDFAAELLKQVIEKLV